MLRKFKKSNDCSYNENGIENFTIQLKLSNENVFIVLIYTYRQMYALNISTLLLISYVKNVYMIAGLYT